ncbi:hypothetical protein OS493_030727 [Desmophyllum pertusum]|uniref:G-protein coupled receptors family 1 profile domain-containing protein n=1 Tax=Desmophyllum pertusum TaxID=174260 RepID=A0A9W9Z8N8_9CNID|nr:hypothetical protein OS493_030727 [Desmophyllum pertusum]
MDFNATDSMLTNATKASSLLNGSAQRELIFKVYLTRGILAIPMALITSFSNGLVIFLFVKDPKKCLRSSPTSLLVASLAWVDFLVGSALEPTDAYYSLSIAFGNKPSVERKEVQSAAAYLLLCSMFLLMLITFDRHTAVTRPIQYSHTITRKRVYFCVFSVCIYCALLIAVIRQWGEEFRNEIFCVHVDVVVVITTVLFCRIVYSLRKQTSELRRLSMKRQLKRLSVSSDDAFVVQASTRERKITLTLALMLVVFLVCTMPWFLMMQIFGYCEICRKNWWVMKLLFILFQANCAFNPILCTLKMPPYRMALRCILSQYTFSRRFYTSIWPARRAYHLQRRATNINNRTSRTERAGSLASSFVVPPVLTQYQFKTEEHHLKC